MRFGERGSVSTMRRALRSLRVRLEQALRARILAALALFAGLAGAMLFWARGVAEYWPNFALNIGAELVAAFVILFAVTPTLRRAQQGGVREHRRLDFDWYVDRVVGAAADVRVLHTFSRLFAPPFDARFMQATTELLRRGGRVQILLLDPDSPAAAQRTAELRGHRRVGPEVRQNLRLLAAYRQTLDEELRQRFQVRLYSAAPSVAIYQWDERLLVSFLPLGGLSGDNTQLEVSVVSPLGNFVAERFDELWASSTPIQDYMELRLAVVDDGGIREYSPRFVVVDGNRYVADAHLTALLARSRSGVVRVTLPEAPPGAFLLDIVEEDSAVAAELGGRFLDKYERAEAAFIRLTPAATDTVGARGSLPST
jgi:hypothetical protein